MGGMDLFEDDKNSDIYCIKWRHYPYQNIRFNAIFVRFNIASLLTNAADIFSLRDRNKLIDYTFTQVT